MGAAEEIAEFAALLRELKQRSGLSYEALAKRSHMSTSTLHRYCKGEGVPADLAAVSRFGRVCRATPEEMVQLHRRWVLADAARERARRAAADAKQDSAGRATEAPATASPSGSGPEPRSAQAPPHTDRPRQEAASDAPLAPPAGPATTPAATVSGPTDPPTAMSGPTEPSVAGGPTCPSSAAAGERAASPAPTIGHTGPSGSAVEPVADTVVLARRTPALIRSARRRWALFAAGTVVVVAVCTALALDLKGGGTDLAENDRPAGTVTASGLPEPAASTPRPSASPSPSARPSRSPASASASASAAPGAGPSARRTGAGDGAQDGAAVPLTVSTRTYAWDDPQCEGKYLIDRPPARVSPPVMGQDVPGWVKAQGAVAADAQRVALTVQGTGDDTVVIESLHVRVVDSSPPPAWNAYLGSSGCGGGVETRSFDTDLDAGHPVIVPKAGQRDVPYKVSQSDPEVLYVTAHARTHDVRWYVELQWSSGGRQGTIRIDDHGRPFRTSGSPGRPVYEYLLGGTEWYRVEGN
ncbi:helix-turn-helix domain-containing protein [Streptomyces collinus]|uniref:DNA-binding protein n=1 Tax=Streptomyces collinus (strain DSM 40733 / Tue 365) TaxID=1214242 RepID=S5UV01_STRC3|nr:helix-turn-helix transcriptional regulator [Streptomyces collinus]AGS69666.1 DNA-binding protein [Streptomyces collinus Tu 365]UJA08307.1 transcriptional regulator [Streptomyces collinus]UJA16828.1 transcriptional regulator [Streptomyces collinus]